MIKYLFTLILIGTLSLSTQAKKSKVYLEYNTEKTAVTVNGEFVGYNPTKIMIDFALGGEMLFFSKGYLSKIVQIQPDNVIEKYKVELKVNNFDRHESSLLFELKEVKHSVIVVNYTEDDVAQTIKSRLDQNGVNIGMKSLNFPNAERDVNQSKYTLGIEPVAYLFSNKMYSSKKYMACAFGVRFTVTDKATGDVKYYNQSNGHYFVKLQNTKGFNITNKKDEVTKFAIYESIDRFCQDPEVQKLFK